jgi:thiosulfate dehydrogenase
MRYRRSGDRIASTITVSNFVHFNLPMVTDYLDPQLSTEDAWDIGAYVVSQPRPKKADREKDFPDLLMKPIDASYAGGFTNGLALALCALVLEEQYAW